MKDLLISNLVVWRGRRRELYDEEGWVTSKLEVLLRREDWWECEIAIKIEIQLEMPSRSSRAALFAYLVDVTVEIDTHKERASGSGRCGGQPKSLVTPLSLLSPHSMDPPPRILVPPGRLPPPGGGIGTQTVPQQRPNISYFVRCLSSLPSP